MGAKTDIFEHVGQTELFQGLSLDGLEDVTHRLAQKTFPAGHTIVHRGDPGASMFIILSGSAAVVLTNAEGWEYTIATLSAGEVFGEMALLTGEPRSANVKAVSELHAVEIHQTEFRDMIRVQPELNTRLLHLLARRLGRTTVQQHTEHWESQEVIANLLSYQQPLPFDRFPGRTKWAIEVDRVITALAASEQHALILGEMGAGKEMVATLIHQRNERGHRPLFSLDCANPPPVLRETQRDPSDAATDRFTEVAQEAALFGHEAGSAAFAVGTRRGYLELADGGTLILQNVEYLGARVQARLLRYLQTRSFTRIGEAEPLRSTVRILACSSHDVEEDDAWVEFNPDLRARLSGEVIHLKPLRKRKQDIPVIAEGLLAHFAQKAHRDIRGFSRDAMNALVDYEWPFNIDELRHVVDRAVAITTGQEITDEHVLLDISPFSTKGTLNLLRFEWVNRLVRKKIFPGALRFASVPGFIALTLYVLLGPQQDNLANLLIWSIGWPLLLLLTVLSARSWCGYCPLPPISNAIGRTTSRFATAPRFVRKHGVWIGIAFVVAIIWAEHATQMFRHPRATGVLLLLILAGAVLSTLAFGRRIWCRHLCPLGQMISQFATISPVVLRSNSNVCLTQCQTHDCVKDDQCPMNLHPSATATSHDCILCLSCVRSCLHRAVRLNLHLPWRGVLEQQKWEVSRAVLPVLLIASVLALRIPAWVAARRVGAEGDPLLAYPGLSGASLAIFAGITVGYMALVLLASGRGRRRGPGAHPFAHVGYAYLPLALAAFFNLYFRKFVAHGHAVLPAIASHLGLADFVRASWITPNLGTFKALAPLVTIVSAIASLYMLRKVTVKFDVPRGAWRANQVVLVCTSVLLLLFS